MMFSVVVLFAVVAAVYLLARLLLVGRRPAGLPPGPPTVPVLGNIHQVDLPLIMRLLAIS